MMPAQSVMLLRVLQGMSGLCAASTDVQPIMWLLYFGNLLLGKNTHIKVTPLTPKKVKPGKEQVA